MLFKGLEPLTPKAIVPKTTVSTNSTRRAKKSCKSIIFEKLIKTTVKKKTLRDINMKIDIYGFFLIIIIKIILVVFY